MEVRSSTVFLLLMLATCILHCQGGHHSADGTPITHEPMIVEPADVDVGIGTDQPEDCELGGPIQEEISSLKERVALLLDALTQHIGDDFQPGATANVTRAESPPAEHPDPCDGIICDVPQCDDGFVVDYSVGCCGACVLDLCTDVECDELPCPEDVQYTPFGCCPLCPEDWGVPPCVISGTCTVEPTKDPCDGIFCDVPQCGPGYVIDYSVGCCGACVEDPCADTECDDLPCPEDLQHTYPGSCCPECPQDWGIDPCELGGVCETATTNPPIPDVCIRPCILIYLPVCGSDGKTYPNQCVFESQNCRNLDVTFELGVCPTGETDPESCGKPCPRIFRPVCGSDGNTYNNECLFEIEKCKNPELTSTEGACLVTPNIEDPCADVECDELPCPEDVQYTPFGCCPQCPADWGVPPCVIAGTCTGAETTEAIQDPCADTECEELTCPPDLQGTYPGNCCPECPQDWGHEPCELSGICTIKPTVIIDPDSCGRPCPLIYRPVCGSDDITYANDCMFEIEKCKNPELTSQPGACSERPKDPCVDVECDALPCPEDVQYTIGCCPECPADWGVPPCVISGTCAVEPTEDPDSCGRPCPLIYRPVCGSDDITYANDCLFEIEKCKNPELSSEPGECSETPKDPCVDVECDELPCPEDVQYTIGCCPECPADWGVPPCVISGTCTVETTEDPDSCGRPCPRIYRPVCGSDDITYANECLFEIEKCKNPELASEPGACSEAPKLIDPCVDVECDELPCPEDVQYKTGCCPECPADWGVPPCVISGTCIVEPTEDPCADTECEELPCPEDLQHTYSGNCCPECPQDWGLDPCHFSGTCIFPQPTVTIDEGGLSPPTDCNDIEALESGIYTLVPGGEGEGVTVYCDFDTAHGPWTVIQRRKDGSENFYRHMADYKAGFGNLEEEFWLGLDNIYRFVSKRTHQLRIDLEDGSGRRKFATYNNFNISGESDGYRLSIGKYSGNARNSLTYHNGMQFSTRDVDNDFNTRKSCARFHKGAWWYKDCLRSNLNGRYRDPARKHPDGIIWAFWRGYTESMRFVEMKIRRV